MDLFSGLFIIDPRGVLRQITINDMPVGRSVDETIRLVQAFQYVEEHGEVGFLAICFCGILRFRVFRKIVVIKCFFKIIFWSLWLEYSEFFKVCPAGWKPGSATIKPDVQQSKEYFRKSN